MAYGPEHLFSSYSLLDLAVTEPFLAKTIVQNSNLGIIIREIVIKSARHFRRIPVWTAVVRPEHQSTTVPLLDSPGHQPKKLVFENSGGRIWI